MPCDPRTSPGASKAFKAASTRTEAGGPTVRFGTKRQEWRAGHGYADVCPEPLAANYSAGWRDGREHHDLSRRLAAVQKEIEKSKAALKAGIDNPLRRAREVERLEALTREAEQLEQAIAALPGR